MNTGKRLNSALGLAVLSVAGLIGTNIYYIDEIKRLERDLASKNSIATLSDIVSNLENAAKESKTNIDQTLFKEYLMDNPDVILKSLAKQKFIKEKKAKEKATERFTSLTSELFNNSNDPIMGNPNGKHVLVEFVDYNCGYCKRLSPILEDFIAKDSEAKVIIKEYPIFKTASSHYSALMGTAIYHFRPEKYQEFHNYVISQNKITKESVDRVIATLGIAKADIKPYLEKAKKQIQRTNQLAKKLQVTGTPTVIFEDGERGHGYAADELVAKFASK